MNLNHSLSDEVIYRALEREAASRKTWTFASFLIVSALAAYIAML